jgi:hypothetical protein
MRRRSRAAGCSPEHESRRPRGAAAVLRAPGLPGVGQAVADRLHHDPEKHEHGDDDEDVHGQSTLQSAEH